MHGFLFEHGDDVGPWFLAVVWVCAYDVHLSHSLSVFCFEDVSVYVELESVVRDWTIRHMLDGWQHLFSVTLVLVLELTGSLPIDDDFVAVGMFSNEVYGARELILFAVDFPLCTIGFSILYVIQEKLEELNFWRELWDGSSV